MSWTLNIGSGNLNTEKGDINLDVCMDVRPTVCARMESIPFKDSTFDCLKAYHILEHIPDIVTAMNECWRVLKKDGTLKTCVPLYPSVGAVADPTHVRYFIPETFEYFVKKGKLPGLKHTFTSCRVGVSQDQSQLFVDMTKKYD